MRNKKEFKATPEMILAAKNVFTCMAMVETIKPIVIGYEKKVLAQYQFKANKKYNGGISYREHIGIILDPKHSHLLGDKDFETYCEAVKLERDKAGLKVERDDFCPLLVAENLLRQAENVLIDVMEPCTGLSHDAIFRTDNPIENKKKFIDLTLKLLARYVK